MKKITLFIAPLAFISLAACSTGQTVPAQTALAEGAACSQLKDDATVAKLYEPGAVYAAKPVQEKVFRARAIQPAVTVGASLYVRAEPAMSAPYLQRVLACHAALGEAAHENDPLHPASGTIAELNVREVQNGFAIDVVAEKASVGEEIWQRAEALSQGSGSVTVQQVASQQGSTVAF